MYPALRSEEGMRTDRAGPNVLNVNNDGVMSRRLAGCVARLGKTASLPGAAQHILRIFWTSCHLRGIDQSILKCRRMSLITTPD